MSFLGLAFLGLHNVFAWIMTLTNAAAGVWSTAAHWKEQLRRRELWYLVTVAQVAVAIQVLLGVLVLQADGLEVQQLHVVYGFVSLASSTATASRSCSGSTSSTAAAACSSWAWACGRWCWALCEAAGGLS